MATSDNPNDPRSVLQQKEQELSRLRETALAQLEAELQAKQSDYKNLQDKFEQLRSDFEYNLTLLSERDEELHQYEQDAALKAAVLADKDRQLAELQASYDEAYQALRNERAAREEEAFLAQSRTLEIQRQLDEHKATSAEAFAKLRDQHEQTKRTLQRTIAESEEALARQQRELAAGFTSQAQQLEVRYRQEAEDAKQEANVAKILAEQRASEAQAAHARELQQVQTTEAAVAESRRLEQRAKALTFELENMRKLKDDTIAELTLHNSQLKHQLKVWSEEADSQRLELAQRLAAAQSQLEDQQSTAAAAAALAAAQHEEEVALLRQRLEQAQSSVNQMAEELQELRSSFKAATKQQQDRLKSLEQTSRHEQEKLSEQLAECQRKHGSELRDAREQLWAREEEVRMLRDKVAELRRSLDERRNDLQTYRDQVLAAGERERELQRRVLTAELRVEDLGVTRDVSLDPKQDQILRSLVEQRDAANAALQDAARRLLDKEVEILSLRDSLATATSAEDANAAMQRATAAAAAARAGIPPPLSGAHHDLWSPRMQRILATASAGGAAGDPAPPSLQPGASSHPRNPYTSGAVSRILRQAGHQPATSPPHHHHHQSAPSQLTIPDPPNAQASLDSLADLALPSPPTDTLPSPQSSATFWAGLMAGRNGSGGGASGAGSVAAAAGAAAARAAQYLRNSKDEIETLLRSRAEDDSERVLGAESSGPSLGVGVAGGGSPRGLALVASLRAALQQSEVQNSMLREALGMMRQEMEALQQAAAAAAVAAAQSGGSRQTQGAPTQDTAPTNATLLLGELQESDSELQQAMQHIRVLQHQLDQRYASSTPLPTRPGTAAPSPPAAPTPSDGTEQDYDSALRAVAVPGVAVVDTELGYLRSRVERLVLEGRQLRREALQLRLAAAGGPVGSVPAVQQGASSVIGDVAGLGQGGSDPLGAGSQQSPAVAFDSAQVPLGPSVTPVQADSSDSGVQGGVQGTAGPNPGHGAPDAPADVVPAEDAALGSRVEELEELNQQLKQQNEQLMEISNELRAERDRLQARLITAGVPYSAEDLYTQPWTQPWTALPGTLLLPPPPGPMSPPPPPPMHAPPPPLHWQGEASWQPWPGAEAGGRPQGDPGQQPVDASLSSVLADASFIPQPGGQLPAQHAYSGGGDMQQMAHSVHRYVVSRVGSPGDARGGGAWPGSPGSSDGVGGGYGSPRSSPGRTVVQQPQRWGGSPPRSKSAGPVGRQEGVPVGAGVQWVRGNDDAAGRHRVAGAGMQGQLPQVVGTGLRLTQMGSLDNMGHSQTSAASLHATGPLLLQPPAGATATTVVQGFVAQVQGSDGAGGGGGGAVQGGPGGEQLQGQGQVAGDGMGMRQGAVSQRETASQRHKLQEMQKRRERMQQGSLTTEAGAAKVRNWNIRQEEDGT